MKSACIRTITFLFCLSSSIASAATIDISVSPAGDGYHHDELGSSYDYFESESTSISAHYQYYGTSDTMIKHIGYSQFSLGSAPAAASIISATLNINLESAYLTGSTTSSGTINHVSNSSGATGNASQRLGGNELVTTVMPSNPMGWNSFDITGYLVNDLNNGYSWSAFSFDPNASGDYANRNAGFGFSSAESGNSAFIRIITGITLTVSPSGSINNGGTVTIAADSGAINGTWNGTAAGGTLAGAYLSGTPVVLTATLPGGTVVSWGTGCDSTTATTCTIDSLTVNTTISPVFSILCYQDNDQDGFGSTTTVTDDGDGVCQTADGESTVNTDCDDTDADEYPGVTWYADGDGDGYGNPSSSNTCERAAGTDVLDSTDCDDADADEHPGVTWYADDDGDGFGDPSSSSICQRAVESDVLDNNDCDDTRGSVHPGGTELCDGLDNDCSLAIDDNLTPPANSFQQGVCSGSTQTCTGAGGWVDDYSGIATYEAGNETTCDTLDNDCDGTADETLTTTYYQDSDSDTYGNASVSQDACTQPVGYVTDNTDCDDSRNTVNPGGTETCDGLDNDCNLSVDDGLTPPANSLQQGVCSGSTQTCSGAGGWVDDYSGIATYEAGTETSCDSLDNNCDGSIDELLITTYYQDLDTDTYGNASVSQDSCTQPPGYVADNSDCDDTDQNINPGIAEICDGIDNNCDTLIDEKRVCSEGFWNLVLPSILNAGGASR